jgi:hypothetical protein
MAKRHPTHSLSLSHTHTHTYTHTHTHYLTHTISLSLYLSISLSLTHTHTLSLSPSLTRTTHQLTHTHTHTHTRSHTRSNSHRTAHSTLRACVRMAWCSHSPLWQRSDRSLDHSDQPGESGQHPGAGLEFEDQGSGWVGFYIFKMKPKVVDSLVNSLALANRASSVFRVQGGLDLFVCSNFSR